MYSRHFLSETFSFHPFFLCSHHMKFKVALHKIFFSLGVAIKLCLLLWNLTRLWNELGRYWKSHSQSEGYPLLIACNRLHKSFLRHFFPSSKSVTVLAARLRLPLNFLLWHQLVGALLQFNFRVRNSRACLDENQLCFRLELNSVPHGSEVLIQNLHVL